MALYPKRIGTENNPEVERLIKLYTDSYSQILDEFASATSFGRAYRLGIMQNIDKILTQLGVDTKAWADKNIPEAYKAGMADAIAQLDHLDAGIKVGASFTTINQDAVKAIIDDAAKSFGDSLTTVSRSAQAVFSQAAREQIKQTIAQGFITAGDRKQIVNNIKAKISEDGISALKDKAGRDWTLDRYADMLARTKIVEARNTGLQNKMLENGYDLVQVSSHGANDVCGDWEDKILSLTGETDTLPDGTPVDGTVDEATADGLFHPNCEHAINAIVPDLASETNAYNTETGEYDAPFPDNLPEGA